MKLRNNTMPPNTSLLSTQVHVNISTNLTVKKVYEIEATLVPLNRGMKLYMPTDR
jgi:hypothetical protein